MLYIFYITEAISDHEMGKYVLMYLHLFTHNQENNYILNL